MERPHNFFFEPPHNRTWNVPTTFFSSEQLFFRSIDRRKNPGSTPDAMVLLFLAVLAASLSGTTLGGRQFLARTHEFLGSGKSREAEAQVVAITDDGNFVGN